MLTLMYVPQKWLQLNPLFIFIFMTLKTSPSPCVLVILIFSPFFPMNSFAFSKIVSSSDISMSQGRLKIFFSVESGWIVGLMEFLTLSHSPCNPSVKLLSLLPLLLMSFTYYSPWGESTCLEMWLPLGWATNTFPPFTFLEEKLIHAQQFALLSRSFRDTSICRWPSHTGRWSSHLLRRYCLCLLNCSRDDFHFYCFISVSQLQAQA